MPAVGDSGGGEGRVRRLWEFLCAVWRRTWFAFVRRVVVGGETSTVYSAPRQSRKSRLVWRKERGASGNVREPSRLQILSTRNRIPDNRALVIRASPTHRLLFSFDFFSTIFSSPMSMTQWKSYELLFFLKREGYQFRIWITSEKTRCWTLWRHVIESVAASILSLSLSRLLTFFFPHFFLFTSHGRESSFCLTLAPLTSAR